MINAVASHYGSPCLGLPLLIRRITTGLGCDVPDPFRNAAVCDEDIAPVSVDTIPPTAQKVPPPPTLPLPTPLCDVPDRIPEECGGPCVDAPADMSDAAPSDPRAEPLPGRCIIRRGSCGPWRRCLTPEVLAQLGCADAVWMCSSCGTGPASASDVEGCLVVVYVGGGGDASRQSSKWSSGA